MKSTKDIDLFYLILTALLIWAIFPKRSYRDFDRLTENGKRVCFVTNNSSKSNMIIWRR